MMDDPKRKLDARKPQEDCFGNWVPRLDVCLACEARDRCQDATMDAKPRTPSR